MPATLRPARPEDAAQIAAIYNHAVENLTATFDTETKSAENRREWLSGRARQHPVIVAETDGKVVGWGAFIPWSDRSAYITTAEMSVYIRHDRVRQGLGRLLSEELLRIAPEVGLRHIISRICTENTASLAMAESLGFATVGTQHRVGRKFDRWLDVVIMEYLVPDPGKV